MPNHVHSVFLAQMRGSEVQKQAGHGVNSLARLATQWSLIEFEGMQTMQFQTLDRGANYNMQGGLWGLEVSPRQAGAEGSNSYEAFRESRPIPSVLSLMREAASSIWSSTSLGGRCSILKGMQRNLAQAVNLTDAEAFESGLPNQLMIEANTPYANEKSQRIVAGLLAMQLVGAGYQISNSDARHMGDPTGKPILGSVHGFQGNGRVGVLLHGLDTRPKAVHNITHFMEAVRSLAGEYLSTHKLLFDAPAHLGASDQLSHRARLTLLTATPQELQENPPLVKNLLSKLDQFEQAGISDDFERAEGLANDVGRLLDVADQRFSS